jgi:hypothetical protein
MQTITRREYEAPMVEMFEAHIEKGFLLSGTRSGSNIEELGNSNHTYDNALFT